MKTSISKSINLFGARKFVASVFDIRGKKGVIRSEFSEKKAAEKFAENEQIAIAKILLRKWLGVLNGASDLKHFYALSDLDEKIKFKFRTIERIKLLLAESKNNEGANFTFLFNFHNVGDHFYESLPHEKHALYEDGVYLLGVLCSLDSQYQKNDTQNVEYHSELSMAEHLAARRSNIEGMIDRLVELKQKNAG